MDNSIEFHRDSPSSPSRNRRRAAPMTRNAPRSAIPQLLGGDHRGLDRAPPDRLPGRRVRLVTR
jgi:hypothetical protein